MKRLPPPAYAPEHAYTVCTSAIADDEKRDRMMASIGDIRESAIDFIGRAIAGSTFEIPPLVVRKNQDPEVVGGIRKSELVNLYEYYMVQRPLGREIYDSILMSAGDKCPICGGIGRPRSLDHYLPKANFPKLSVLPDNLIPACRDCNTDKGNPLFTHPHEQLIHPYYDQACFFDQAWIIATVSHIQPCVITFEAKPPETWRPEDQQRGINHFAFFDLAKRYSIMAAEEVSILVDQRRSLMKDLPVEGFRAYLASVGDSPILFPNHWRKVMYAALANDGWFCETQF
ncbi:HNH endonuclease [Pseudomonas marginalis]|jgi:hypothetical protein|uniref:HNH endonuclease n=1 Tax=Pseudomonas marginalis TaxID=298 RepID=UPI0038B5B4F0